MEIINSNKVGAVSEKSVKKFEFQIGALLPKEYRTFLLKHNGGEPVPSDFKLGEDDISGLHHIYGIFEQDNHRDILNNYNVFKGRIKKELLPIADDSFGNQICIGIKNKYIGKIYFWDHEFDGSFFKSKAITLIANSFNNFLDSLFEYVDPDESVLSRVIRLGDITELSNLIDNGLNIEEIDEHGRTIIERCAIKGDDQMIEYLFELGAQLKTSLELAENNAKYFESHLTTVRLLKNLSSKK
jgi:ankyrin repeat protein